MREIVIPGEKLSDRRMRTGFGAYIKDGAVFSSVYGIPEHTKGFIRVVPLKGKYIPHEGDHVIGIVKDVKYRGCFVDINSPYVGYLPLNNDEDYDIGDILLIRVAEVSSVNEVMLAEPKKLYDGKLVEIQPVKIPRVIGKRASMLRILREAGNCIIFVGRNGRVFVKGDTNDVKKVEEALRMIEEEAHTYGLTARVKKFLEGG